MKTKPTTFEQFESTYAMLLRSEEKERSASEMLIYALLILSAVFSIWQLALRPITVPTNLLRSVSAAHAAQAPRIQA